MNKPVRDQAFVNVSEIYFASRPTRVYTVLGSCVAVTMRDEIAGHAAICHARLPSNHCGRYSVSDRYCYVDEAIDYMLMRLEVMGCSKRRLEIKAFGGANIADVNAFSSPNRIPIGDANIKALHQSMRNNGVALLSSDLGGRYGRKLFYHTDSGNAYVKVNTKSDNDNEACGPLIDFVFN